MREVIEVFGRSSYEVMYCEISDGVIISGTNKDQKNMKAQHPTHTHT